jgi:hypothetical protein
MNANAYQTTSTKKSIYGFIYEIAGAVQMTNKNTGKQKYFLVCRLQDNAENRRTYGNNDGFINRDWVIRFTSDFSGITQRVAAAMPQVDHTEFNYPEWDWV